MTTRVLITGGGGFIGRQVANRLATDEIECVVSLDVQDHEVPPGVHRETLDVRDPGLADLLRDENINHLIHLASIVSPAPHHTRQFLYSVDVEGTRNVLEACLAAGVEHITVTSSGAAYGYHPDNPEWIDEDDPLRGNAAFAYSDHKRIVEEMLAVCRRDRPDLAQLILRPGTILGSTVNNQITALFNWPFILGVRGSETPFVFIWDEDVVNIISKGSLEDRTGVYNLAGTGSVPLRQIAEELSKPFVVVPASMIRGALRALGRANVVPYGPEQVDFLRYRPVLSNKRLIEDFGYTPAKSSIEAFRAWCDARD